MNILMSRLLKIKNSGNASSLKRQTKHIPPMPRNYREKVKANDPINPSSR